MPLDPVLLSTPGWEAVVGEPRGVSNYCQWQAGGRPGLAQGVHCEVWGPARRNTREGGEGTSTDGLLSVALEEIVSLNITGTTLVVVRSI